MSKKQVFYIAFFTILVAVFIGAMALIVPDFFKTKFPPVSKVEPFQFKNQLGDTITEEDMKGKVVAVNYFFTTCKSICPRMSNNLKPVYHEFLNQPDFLIVSHTSDPERDSVPVLKRYADSLQVNAGKWQFLTGDKDKLYYAARHSYMIDDPNNFVSGEASEFLHTQFVALVNKKGEVVHIYDGIKQSEMQEMIKHIKRLLRENG